MIERLSPNEHIASLALQGLSIIECIKNLRDYEKCSLQEAKRLVSQHPAYRSAVEDAEELLDDLSDFVTAEVVMYMASVEAIRLPGDTDADVKQKLYAAAREQYDNYPNDPCPVIHRCNDENLIDID